MSDWLLIDHGNSRIKWAVVQKHAIQSLPTVPANNDGLNTIRDMLISQSCLDASHALITSVGDQTLLTSLCTIFKERMTVHQPQKQNQFLDLTLGYPDINQLGMDRWLNMLGAQALNSNKPLVVVSVGTAMTIDVVDEQGQHLGGMIAPSPWLAWHGMNQRIPSLPEPPKRFLTMPKQLGNDTQSCIQTGVMAASVGAMDQAVSLCAQASQKHPVVVITGGGYAVLKEWLSLAHCFEPQLLFWGMKQYIQQMFPS